MNGPDAREVYTFLKDATGGTDIAWNFEIFLLDQNGVLVERFNPSRSPYDTLKPEIEKLL